MKILITLLFFVNFVFGDLFKLNDNMNPKENL